MDHGLRHKRSAEEVAPKSGSKSQNVPKTASCPSVIGANWNGCTKIRLEGLQCVSAWKSALCLALLVVEGDDTTGIITSLRRRVNHKSGAQSPLCSPHCFTSTSPGRSELLHTNYTRDEITDYVRERAEVCAEGITIIRRHKFALPYEFLNRRHAFQTGQCLHSQGFEEILRYPG